MKDFKYRFLEKVLLGQDTDFLNEDEIISKCIAIAYKDALSAGRYYSLPNDIKLEFKKLLEKEKYIFSIDLIEKAELLFSKNEKLENGISFVTSFGLAQKLVNMTYKYLYIFNDYLSLNINYSNCDCPLDSIIFSKLKYTTTVWSKITKEEYIKCQDLIKLELSKMNLDNNLKSLNNLAYDFINW